MHTEFSAFTVPAAPEVTSGNVGHVLPRQPTPDAEPHASTLESARSSTPRILLAEDNDDLRAIARVFLQAEGYEVFACADGQRAIGILKSGIELDLLLTDVEMPHATGIEVAAVAATLHPKHADRDHVRGCAHGVYAPGNEVCGMGFFAKPFPLPDMLTSIHERLRPVGRVGSPLAA